MVGIEKEGIQSHGLMKILIILFLEIDFFEKPWGIKLLCKNTALKEIY